MRRFILTIFVFFVLIVPAQAEYLYSWYYGQSEVPGGPLITECSWDWTGDSIIGQLEGWEIMGSELTNVTARLFNTEPWTVQRIQFWDSVQPDEPWMAVAYFSQPDTPTVTSLNYGFTVPASLVGTWESDIFETIPTIDSTLTITEITVPEAVTIILLCSGLIGLAGLRRKFKG